MTVAVASATSESSPIDTDANGTLATKKSQFNAATVSTSFNAVLDVATARKAFVTDTTDTVAWTITNPDTTGWLNVASITSTVVTVKGESGKFTGLDSSHFAVAGGGTAVYTSDSDNVVVTYSSDVTSDTLTFTPPTGDSAVAMNAQSFTVDVVYNYNNGASTASSTTVVSGISAGAWTQNGATVVVPYMPYSDNASQIIYLTNKGTLSGDISVTAYDESGNAYDLGVMTTTSPGKLTKLATLIKTALEAKGVSKAKLTLTITAEVPKADIIVFASYNVGGSDRGFVNTDQYLSN